MTTNIVTIVVALGSIAALVLYILKRVYGPPPESHRIYDTKAKLQNTRAEIAKELAKIKATPAVKRDWTRFNELIAERKRLSEELKNIRTT